MLTKLTLEGYKSFRKLELELRPLNVLIGANGAGKSNLVSFFRLMREIASGRLRDSVTKSGGADSILRYGKKKTPNIDISLVFIANTYEISIEPDEADSMQVVREVWLEANGNGISTITGNRTPESRMDMLEHFPLMYQEYKEVYPHFRTLLLGFYVYHFHDMTSTAAIKSTSRINDNIDLDSEGGNLAACLYRIYIEHRNAYKTIRDVIRSVAPYFDDFLLRPNPLNPDSIRLEWREQGSDFPFLARDLSDGTLRFMALTTLLLQPDPPAITVIDEPELGLHPFAIEKLASLLQVASSRTQLIVATQSPQLISALEPEDVIVMDRKDGESTAQRLDVKALEGWLEEYTLGELWQKNVLGGVVNPNLERSRNNS